jgi:hypothetical protein
VLETRFGIKKMKFKKIIAMILIGFSAYSWGSDNSIYIDQSGDNATIAMTQDGASNVVRGVGAASNNVASKLYGDGLTVTVQQIGSGNTLNLGAQTGTSGGVASSISYNLTGNNNLATISMNNAGTKASLSNLIDIAQAGDNTVTTISMLGNSNYLRSIQSGNSNKIISTVDANNTVVNVNQTGGTGNETTLQLTGDKGTVDVVTVGATNIIGITQSGGGVTGHYAKIDLNGSSNQVSISQSGSIDMTTNIKGVGNSNSFTIIQRN